MRHPLLALLKKTALTVGGHGLGRIKPLRWAYDRLYGALKPSWVWVQGHKMFLDEMDTLELATREIYEPLETRLLLENLEKGQTFVDIGANIGYYTLLAARQVGPQGRVLAFEPDPDNFKLLQKNVETNGYGNVALFNQALCDRPGEAKLFLNPRNRGDHRIYDSGDGRAFVRVPQIRLDDCLKAFKSPPHFIKMDIQGAEAGALAGMAQTLAASGRLILVAEFGPENLRRFGADPDRFLKDLSGLGFRIREISETRGELQAVDLAELSKRFPPGDEGYTNLFCEKE
ncbi:MAG TPA: FkbM family methyltransferase [bacterium]|nr:FkbM family methyltransferase [bacterium]